MRKDSVKVNNFISCSKFSQITQQQSNKKAFTFISPNKKYSGLGIKRKEFIHKCLLYRIFKALEGVNMVHRYVIFLYQLYSQIRRWGQQKTKQTKKLTRLAGVMALYKKLLMINKVTNTTRSFAKELQIPTEIKEMQI